MPSSSARPTQARHRADRGRIARTVVGLASSALVVGVVGLTGIVASEVTAPREDDAALLLAAAVAERQATAEQYGDLKTERQTVLSRAAERTATASRSEARTVAVSGDPRSIARSLLGEFGFSADQFDCLDALWVKESNWQTTAANPSSSAYGIPQALPGSKMASAGADWATNPATQIRWGLGYISERYGSPCGAYSHSQSVGWY